MRPGAPHDQGRAAGVMRCLNEETIVAFVGARLAPEGVERVEAHARSCPSCRELVSLALLATPLSGGRASPESRHERRIQPAPPVAATQARGTSFGRYTML